MGSRLAVLLLAALPTISAAQTYRWVDRNGQVHFTQFPPKSGEYTIIGGAPKPAAAPNQDALNQSLEQSQVDRAKEEEAAGKRAREQAEKQERCRQAVEQLAYLEAKTARRIASTNADGEVVRDTEEQFEQRLDAQRAAMKENCD